MLGRDMALDRTALGPWSLPVLAGWALLAVACGSAQTPPEEPTASPADEPMGLEPSAPSDAPAESAPPEPAPAPTGSADEPDSRGKFREITPRECQALGGKYGELTRADETAKLNPKLTDKQRAQAAESIDAAARTLESRWVESCTASLLGKEAEEQAITCAMSAKNVAAFDTCLNGPK